MAMRIANRHQTKTGMSCVAVDNGRLNSVSSKKSGHDNKH
jgi:hypothetical protein